MSFTTPILVKTHLLTSTFPEQVIRNYPVSFNGTPRVELPHHNLVADSAAVKQDLQAAPFMDNSATLKGEEFVALQYSQLVPGSVVVTLSEALTALFVEERDFQVDYTLGALRRLATGTIPDQQPVIVYYSYFTLFERDTDYTLDDQTGLLTRAEDGAIADGAAALVDYVVTAGTVEDDLIEQAITEAEDMIIRSLAEEYNASSTNQGLKTGATELALSIICRALTMEALSRRATTDIPGRAKEWQQLARTYEQQAWQTLAPFLAPMALRSTYHQGREKE